ncbi:hypothetical protein GEMRC1_013999 [Eukaryota sp. GEM-RC1]
MNHKETKSIAEYVEMYNIASLKDPDIKLELNTPPEDDFQVSPLTNGKELSISSDLNGDFSFEKIKIGSCNLTFLHQSYYNHSKQIGLVKSDANRHDINLDPKFYQLSGVVSDKHSGELLKQVKLTISAPHTRQTVHTNSNGIFTIDLWSGSYTFNLQHSNYISSTQSLSITSSTAPVSFSLARSNPDLNIIVVDELSGLPVQGVSIVLETFDVYAITEEEGELSFPDSRSGPYFLSLSHSLYHNTTLAVYHTSSAPQLVKLLPVTSHLFISCYDSLTNARLVNVSAVINSSSSLIVTVEDDILAFTEVRMGLYEVELYHELYLNSTIFVEVLFSSQSISTPLDPVLITKSGSVTSINNTPLSGVRIDWSGGSVVSDSNGLFYVIRVTIAINCISFCIS